jgi:hypothetical protein
MQLAILKIYAEKEADHSSANTGRTNDRDHCRREDQRGLLIRLLKE